MFFASCILLLAACLLGLHALLREEHAAPRWRRWGRIERRLARLRAHLRGGTLARPIRRNLPGELLHRRLQAFRVEGATPDTGLARSYTVRAKHAGAALAKARHWGLRVRHVERQGP